MLIIWETRKCSNKERKPVEPSPAKDQGNPAETPITSKTVPPPQAAQQD